MPPRRSHKKSRDGCRRCKSRKIKCDEVHPRCGNCVKHGVGCDFEQPGYGGTGAMTLAGAAHSTPRSRAISLPTASPTTSLTPANLSTTGPATSLGANPLANPTSSTPLYRTPGAVAVSQTTPTSNHSRLLELRLMHQYISMTSKTLTVTAPITEEVWRDVVPQIAFAASSHHLTDGILAVAALHLRSLCPHDQEVVRASHAYMASSLREYSDVLTRGIDASNAEALFLTSTLIAIQSTATRVFTKDESVAVAGAGTLARASNHHSGYSLPMSWFHSFQGVKAITAASWLWLRQSNAVIPIINSQPVLHLDFNSTEPTFFGHLLEGLDQELAALPPDHVAGPAPGHTPTASSAAIAGHAEAFSATTGAATTAAAAATAAVVAAAAAATAAANSTSIPSLASSASIAGDAGAASGASGSGIGSGTNPAAAARSPTGSRRQATRQAYEHAVAVLNWAHKIPHKGSPLAFPATVSRRFVELVEERRPRALAILASFFALLKCLDPIWWLRGMARREVLGIISLFNSDYFGPEIERQWWPHLEWAVRVALHDDKDNPGYVPPDLWGSNWLSDDTPGADGDGGPDFVSHIEMVSQMVTNGLSSFPAPSS